MKLNAGRERKKAKRRRKEKRKRLETVEQKRKHQDNTSLTEEVKQPMEFDFQHDSYENFQIIERRKAIILHSNGHHDHVNCARSFCACWVFSLHHSDIDVGLLPCLIELKKCIHQVLSSKQVDIVQKEELGSRPFCEFHYPNGKAKVISDGSCLQIESQFRELILKWVPPPLESLNTEFSDQQWLYDRGPPLRIGTNKKTSAARSDHLCYPYTTLF